MIELNGTGAYGVELEQKLTGEDLRNIEDQMESVKLQLAANELDANRG